MYDVAPSEPKKRGYFAKFRALRAPPLLRRKISETLVRANELLSVSPDESCNTHGNTLIRRDL